MIQENILPSFIGIVQKLKLEFLLLSQGGNRDTSSRTFVTHAHTHSLPATFVWVNLGLQKTR